MIEVLEQTTSKFLNNETYKNDEQYVRLWLYYADQLPEPLEVFELMLGRFKIGVYCALSYEAHALVLEHAKAYPKARTVFEDGIAK